MPPKVCLSPRPISNPRHAPSATAEDHHSVPKESVTYNRSKILLCDSRHQTWYKKSGSLLVSQNPEFIDLHHSPPHETSIQEYDVGAVGLTSVVAGG